MLSRTLILAFLSLACSPTTNSSASRAPDEISPPGHYPCFPGAYYRKAVSSVDSWTGFDGVVTLPSITFDESRRRPKNPAQFLDNPSIYIGGHAGPMDDSGTEIDAGLSLEVIREPNGSVSKERKAFRPFWRNKGWFAAPARPDYYFFPGDTVRMKIETIAKDHLTLTITLISRGEASKPILAAYAATQPTKALPPPEPLVVEFNAPLFGPGEKQEFKRVNAIDLVGREGKDVDPTKTIVSNAEWKEASLLRADGKIYPFTPHRFTDMRCPAEKHHEVKTLPNGGERITIFGAGKK